MSQCHCKLHGHLYAPGQQVTNDCEQWWVCGRGPGPAAGASGCGGPRLTLSPAARQRLQRRPLGVQRPAMSRDLCPGGRLPHHHLRREEVHLPRRLLLRADQGRPAAGRGAWGRGRAPRSSPQPLPSPQGDHNSSYALLGELAPCGSTDKQTCLKTVVLLADQKKNVGIPSPSLPCTPGPQALLNPAVRLALPSGGGLQVRRQRPAERAAGEPATCGG